jgi:redox-sensing transcriptional repressor
VGDTARRRIPEATVARLPVYYRALLEAADQQVATISSERLAELAGVNAAKVRKDLSYLGSYGTRGVGYDVDYLLHEISRELGLTRDWPVAIVGIGNLGRALANYRGFGARGFRIVALVDADPDLVGKEVGDLTIEPIAGLARIVEERKITIGMIATPAPVAQEVADQLVEAGVRSILNFAPAVLTVPSGVSIRKVDLAIELQILSFYQLRKSAPGRRRDPVEPDGGLREGMAG